MLDATLLSSSPASPTHTDAVTMVISAFVVLPSSRPDGSRAQMLITRRALLCCARLVAAFLLTSTVLHSSGIISYTDKKATIIPLKKVSHRPPCNTIYATLAVKPTAYLRRVIAANLLLQLRDVVIGVPIDVL